MDPLAAAIQIASSGLSVQSTRARVVTENIANAQSTGDRPGSNPYQRKTVSFEAESGAAGAAVRVDQISESNDAYRLRYEPANPAANPQGQVKYPDIDMLVEMADLKEALRSYEANLEVARRADTLINETIDLLKGA